MSNKIICPFCGYELQENRTTNLCCPICGLVAPTKLWQALIQAKQDLDFFIKEQVRTQTALIERTKELDKCQKDLEIATKALEEYADEDMWENCCQWDIEYIQGLFLEHGYKIAKEALEQIEQKEERNESIRSNIDD